MKAILLIGLFAIATPALAAPSAETAAPHIQPGVIWDSATTIRGAPPRAPYRDPSDVIQGKQIQGPAPGTDINIRGTAPQPPQPRPDRPLGIG